MRILLISDLHSDEYALEKIKEIVSKQKFEHVFITGDLTKRAVSYVDDLLELLPNCFAIPGNCDPPEVLRMIDKKGCSVHGKRIEIGDGLNIVGFGYSPPTPFHTIGEKSEDELKKEMLKLNIDKNTLLMTHAPPKGVHDVARGEHVGSMAVREIIEKKQPLANFCGHVHELAGVDRIGGTTVIKIPAANAKGYAIAEINNKKLKVEFLEL